MLVRRPSITQTDCSFILNILYIHKKGYSLNRSAMTVENSRQSFMTDDFRCWPYQDLSSGTRIRALHVSRSMFQYEPCIHAKSQLGVLTIILYWVKINHVCKQSLLKRLSIFLHEKRVSYALLETAHMIMARRGLPQGMTRLFGRDA